MVLIPLAPAGIPILAASLGIGVAHLVKPAPATAAMSTAWVVIIGLAAGVYALKAAAPLALANRRLPPTIDRLAALLPAALLAALVVVSTFDGGRRLVLDACCDRCAGGGDRAVAAGDVHRRRARRRSCHRAGPPPLSSSVAPAAGLLGAVATPRWRSHTVR